MKKLLLDYERQDLMLTGGPWKIFSGNRVICSAKCPKEAVAMAIDMYCEASIDYTERAIEEVGKMAQT